MSAGGADGSPAHRWKSPDLIVGADAQLTLTFSTAGDLNIRVPIVDANQPDYATITPSAAPSSPTSTARQGLGRLVGDASAVRLGVAEKAADRLAVVDAVDGLREERGDRADDQVGQLPARRLRNRVGGDDLRHAGLGRDVRWPCR